MNPKLSMTYPSAFCGRILCALIGICLLYSGCGPTTTWSAESRSPDGLWVAIVRTDQYSGPGNAGLYSTVYLKRTKGDKTPIEVLLLDQQETGPIILKTNWLSSSHLEVAYTQHPSLDFQAVKCAGIDISVRDLPGEITGNSK
jgi:hypothetical protein